MTRRRRRGGRRSRWSRSIVSEQIVSKIWQAQWLRRDDLRTVDGRRVRVVYRGRWSHGLGPDFRDALIVFDDGPLLRGDVEIHLRAADWHAHGHEHDPAYTGVILHVTLALEAVVCRRSDGAVLPQLALAPFLPGSLDDFAQADRPALGLLGSLPCAARSRPLPPAEVSELLRAAGRARLQARAAQVEARAEDEGADQALYSDLLDALGYSHNREPFRALAQRLPLAALDNQVFGLSLPAARRRLAALLLGAAGFLPWKRPGGLALAPDWQAAVERDWQRHGQAWVEPAWEPLRWSLARARPANHPARRLLGLAALLAGAGPALLPSLLLNDTVADTAGSPSYRLTVQLWPEAAAGAAPTLIGPDRAREIAVNVLAPHALARAAQAADPMVAERIFQRVAALPAGSGNAHTRAVRQQLGPTARPRGALEEQGLLHLYRAWCSAQRCFACPIATATRGGADPRTC
jgi:hypothetical protein